MTLAFPYTQDRDTANSSFISDARDMHMYMTRPRDQTVPCTFVNAMNPAAGFSISQEEALRLLPVLQVIASGSPTSTRQPSTPSTGSVSSYSAGSSPFFVPIATGLPKQPQVPAGCGYTTDSSDVCRYSSDDLLQTKAKNSKSPIAHNYCHVSSCVHLHRFYRSASLICCCDMYHGHVMWVQR